MKKSEVYTCTFCFPTTDILVTTRWNQADDKTKSLVHGYIRQIPNKLKELNIPIMINCHCISYYFVMEYFTKHGNNIKVNEYGNIAEGKQTDIEET